MTETLKEVEWVGDSLKTLREFPEDVKDELGFALRQAQQGKKSDSAKPLKVFTGSGVLEIISNFDGDTFRLVYTVRFKYKVYVLHIFQKKSKRGISTSKQHMNLIDKRLKKAESLYREEFGDS